MLPVDQIAGQVVRINFTCLTIQDSGCLVIKIAGRGDEIKQGEKKVE